MFWAVTFPVFAEAAEDVFHVDNRVVDPRAVRANIERLHAEDPERPLVVQAARTSRAETLVTVMDASRQADVYDISIASSQ